MESSYYFMKTKTGGKYGKSSDNRRDSNCFFSIPIPLYPMIDTDKLPIKEVLQNSPEIAAAYLFGSAANREPVVNDIDILILPWPQLDPLGALFDVKARLIETLKLPEEKLDVLLFDLKYADPEVLYSAVNTGILLKDEDTDFLTDRIEELSRYFLENEYLIRQAEQLRQEMLDEFCRD